MKLVNRRLPTLYKPHASGNGRVFWRIEYRSGKVRAVSGKEGGKENVGAWTVAQPTNEGRANARTAEEQAAFIAESHWKKKLKRGYSEDGEQAAFRLYPMLAQTFDPDKAEDATYYVQPKLNGARCLISKDGMFSRNGERFVSCPHIEKALAPVFRKYPKLVLDGELYNHELHDRLNKTMSLIRKTRPSKADLLESAKTVQYWAYDCFEPGNNMEMRERSLLLCKCLQPLIGEKSPIKAVKSAVAYNAKQVDIIFGMFCKDNYEGAIVRPANGIYEPRRSKWLLKYKPWKDGEFEVVSIESGKGKKAGDIAAKVICRHRSGKWKGNEFSSNIVGDYAYLRKLYLNRAKLVGTLVTVRYAYITEYGKPFHPEATLFWYTKNRTL